MSGFEIFPHPTSHSPKIYAGDVVETKGPHGDVDEPGMLSPKSFYTSIPAPEIDGLNDELYFA